MLIVDRFGELQAIYAEADVAVVGGTLAERGGHNVAEPARLGRAVVVGPHVEHVRSLVDALRAADAIVCLDDTRHETLRDALAALLDDSGRRTALGDRARQAVVAHTGAADRTAQRLVQFVELRAGAVVPGNPLGLPSMRAARTLTVECDGGRQIQPHCSAS